ncbi:hypothetical protein [Chitinophaga niabensis]|uniref:RiboL-PSP-HEPN domain-containing protein n=1 Tax=Chitinophaga niabensis TaxID=536979 RepID=A0A1N6JB98_9BACT|nr:hypothetical protein [Chitinophaga niabensis]SIO41517.1 hypothetical protein SAMN04488055_3821 [Chitinophaga niabensis]
MTDVNNFLLTENITVGQTKQWIKNKNEQSKENLIKLINHRFYNRYVKHLKKIDSGFLKMAISCLMIETMESFVQGKKNTKGKGVGLKMFKDFFKRESKLFPNFDSIAVDFYSNIRCGILHQAETTNAWRILRKDSLLDKKNKTVNATKFVLALNKSLGNYIKDLERNDFNSRIWKNAIVKLEDICENCKVSY